MTPEQIERLKAIIEEVKLQKAALETLTDEVRQEDPFTADDLQVLVDALGNFFEQAEQRLVT